MSETKSEIRARIDELLRNQDNVPDELRGFITRRLAELREDLSSAQEDLFTSVVQSHKVLCAVKQMNEKAAYGQDPAMYYALAICGEAGEMANKIVKALRNGNDPTAVLEAIKSELPDVFIYSAVLGYVLGFDITKMVNEKVQIIVDRANSGYYGGPLK